jgi:hypothetical protein
MTEGSVFTAARVDRSVAGKLHWLNSGQCVFEGGALLPLEQNAGWRGAYRSLIREF